jgi:hypothetical protein
MTEATDPTTVQTIATTTEKVIEGVMKIEPTIVGVSSMFIPGMAPIAAMVQPWVLTLVPYVEKALNDIAAGNNGDLFASFIELLQHVSAGGPNSKILSQAANDPTPVGQTA